MFCEIKACENGAGLPVYKFSIGEDANCVVFEIDAEALEEAVLDSLQYSLHFVSKGVRCRIATHCENDASKLFRINEIVADALDQNDAEHFQSVYASVGNIRCALFTAGRNAGLLPDPFDVPIPGLTDYPASIAQDP